MGTWKHILAGTCLAVFMNTGFADPVNPDLPPVEVLTKKYLEEISLRKVGQTRFARKKHTWRHGPQTEVQQSESRDSTVRAIQEADVFKLGKSGKKELFLLNNYRGFQVVTFEEGLERPRLKGRLPIYNNWSSEMYYLEAMDRVVIVNTEWDSNYQTGIYLIDVSDSSSPKLVEKISVSGYLSESRFVGDVLYAITSNWSGTDQRATIHSVRPDYGALKPIDRTEVQGDKEYVRTMNVVQSGEKYYVLSTLSNWSASGDVINVHDISSAQGDVVKLFSARARGRIDERSNTFIHRNHLFAVSNYRRDQNSPLRISVEAFPMDARGEELVSRETMRLSMGDTNGLHASLQDVRVSGDLLYAFWVPANNVDPFELIDISDPAKGLRHLGQLRFDGWISKAFPLDVGGKKYVLGLGEIVPTSREDGKRFPQAKIFEIKNENGNYRHEAVASLTIDSEDVWSALNSGDKYFEIVEEGPGVFNVLFPVYLKRTWNTAGKVVTADLNHKTLIEGATITGEEGWIKRVFLNREVRSLHSFSDQSLETFRQSDMNGRGLAKAVSMLELARDVVDFHVVSGDEGIQVVGKNKEVQLRRVALNNTDAEAEDVTSMVSVKGKYEWHKFRDGRAYIVTSFTKKQEMTSGTYQWETELFDHANLTVVDLASGSLITDRVPTTRLEGDNRFYYHFELQAIPAGNDEILKINNEFFRLVDHSLKRLVVEEGCRYFFDNKSESFSLESVNAEIYAFTTFDVKAKDGEEIYELPFTKKVSVSGTDVSCSPSVSVPGRPVFRTNDLLITSDLSSRWYYSGRYHYEYYDLGHWPHRPSNKTYSLKYTGPQEVTLVDVLDKDITNSIFDGGFVTYDTRESRLDLWRVSTEGEFLVRPQYLGLSSERSSLITLMKMNGKAFAFLRNGTGIDLYEVTKNRANRVSVTSTYDRNLDDGSAENIFSIRNISPSTDGSRFHVSQGLYGVSDIVVK